MCTLAPKLRMYDCGLGLTFVWLDSGESPTPADVRQLIEALEESGFSVCFGVNDPITPQGLADKIDGRLELVRLIRIQTNGQPWMAAHFWVNGSDDNDAWAVWLKLEQTALLTLANRVSV